MGLEHVKATEQKLEALPEQAEEEVKILSSRRVISRKSSVGCSSRVFYYRNAEGVPFQWEMQPGKPRDPPKEEILPPLSPPPAMLSLGLPKPCITVEDTNKASFVASTLKFWKRIKNRYHPRKELAQQVHRQGSSSIRYEYNNHGSDDEESLASQRDSSASSFSSMSFSTYQSRQSSRLEDGSSRGSIWKPFGCSPVNFSSIVVAIAKRT